MRISIQRQTSEIKKRLEDAEGRTVNDRILNELLNTLINLSIIEKTNNKYIIVDPIIRKAVEDYWAKLMRWKVEMFQNQDASDIVLPLYYIYSTPSSKVVSTTELCPKILLIAKENPLN